MRTILLLLIFTAGYTLSNAQMKYELQVNKKTENLELNAFDFSTIFYEKIIFDFKLYKNFNDNSLQKILTKIFNAINSGGKANLSFLKYDGINSLKIAFMLMNTRKGKAIVLLSNYIPSEKRIALSRTDRPKTWATWYKIKGQRLVKGKRKKFIPNPNAPKYFNDVNRVNLYMLNGEKEKYDEIESTLLSVIKMKNNFSPFCRIVLSQLYCIQGKFNKSYEQLNKVEKSLDSLNQGSSREIYSAMLRLTRNEVKFAETISKRK